MLFRKRTHGLTNPKLEYYNTKDWKTLLRIDPVSEGAVRSAELKMSVRRISRGGIEGIPNLKSDTLQTRNR